MVQKWGRSAQWFVYERQLRVVLFCFAFFIFSINCLDDFCIVLFCNEPISKKIVNGVHSKVGFLFLNYYSLRGMKAIIATLSYCMKHIVRLLQRKIIFLQSHKGFYFI